MVDADYNILNKARILLVEGNESNHSHMIEYFSKITRLFTVVKSAEEALPLLDGPLWDIVVCNLKLPGINGLEFCKCAIQQKPGTKIILATQYPDQIKKENLAANGIVEIVSTPLTPESLISPLIFVHSSVSTSEISTADAAESSFDVPETVSILDLDNSMIITAFVRFGEKYRALSTQTCAWIKHNFRDAHAVVNRNGHDVDLSINKIEPGDNLRKLHHFPVHLMNLTFVRDQLIKELKQRDFLAFEVKRKPTEQSLNQQIRGEAIRRAERFIDKVNESVAIRDSAGETIKELLSGNIEDGIDTYDLLNHVENIAKSGTAKAISAIAALKKSDQTYTHCVDVGAIFFNIYSQWVKEKRVTSRFDNEAEILLSATLHDVGKILLPNEILESPDTFDVYSREMFLMRNHPIDSARILSDLYMPPIAVNMALYHHAKFDTSILSSYPSINSYKKVLTETRLLAIVDMFQALVSGRPYQRSWHPSAAMQYIDRLAGIECDLRIWTVFRETLGWYPAGSLVQLNDGSQAFVLDQSTEYPDRPSVAILQNSFGEELTHNTFFDLDEEKDIFVEKGLDHYQIYGDEALNKFTQLQVS